MPFTASPHAWQSASAITCDSSEGGRVRATRFDRSARLHPQIESVDGVLSVSGSISLRLRVTRAVINRSMLSGVSSITISPPSKLSVMDGVA